MIIRQAAIRGRRDAESIVDSRSDACGFAHQTVVWIKVDGSIGRRWNGPRSHEQAVESVFQFVGRVRAGRVPICRRGGFSKGRAGRSHGVAIASREKVT